MTTLTTRRARRRRRLPIRCRQTRWRACCTRSPVVLFIAVAGEVLKCGAGLIEQAVSAPPLRTGGDKDGGGGSAGGGGGGGGGGNSPPLHKRSSDNEFRDVLGSGLANARRNLVTVGLFSVAVNLLVLAIPIYLFNMSDRVLTSRSTDTLVMLTIIVIIAIAAHVLMDMLRRIILMRVAVETEARLGGPVLSAAAKAAQSGSSREFQTLADLQHLRSFITGPVLLTMFDTPV